MPLYKLRINITTDMKKILFICFSLFSFYGMTQEKIEHEVHIPTKNTPEKSRKFIDDSFPEHRKIKWYFEHGTENNYEAKFRYHKHRFSVEFDTLGNLVDVELKIKWKEIDKGIQKNIKSELNALYERHRIFKIQEQLSGEEEKVKETLIREEFNKETITAYEIDVKGKTSKGIFLYEHLFDKTGKLIKTVQIIPPNMDFIEY